MSEIDPGRMPTVMKHDFSRAPQVKVPRSAFDRSHGHKTTFNSGYLIPVFVDEALPGDTMNVKMTSFARMQTPMSPFMDNMFLDSFFFAVPKRLLWDNFEKFNGAQTDPDDSIDFQEPVMTAPAVTGHAIGSLSDYFGIPTGIATLQHSSLWHRAYNKIWNEWFRAEDIQDSVVVDTDDGPDSTTDYALLRRGKRHDYFTSCLPWPLKGGVEVDLPLGTDAPVLGILTSGVNSATGAVTYGSDGSSLAIGSRVWSASYVEDLINAAGTAGAAGHMPNVRADLSNATAATINELREAFQVQRLLERDARGGTRYVEHLKSQWGVTSPDFRLQRSEYLGGGSTPIHVHPVAQTSETDATPQGTLTAFATASATHGFVKSFTEHCVVIGLVEVRADLNYQQGLNRMFSKRTRYDHYLPVLANLGEQAVLNKEIYCQNDANDDLVFGYQERWAEYRYKPSMITGKFRSTAAGSLDMWHLAQEFGALPTLNDTFIVDNPPVSRVVAVTTEPEFYFDSYFKFIHVRPMPVYSVPGMIDHF